MAVFSTMRSNWARPALWREPWNRSFHHYRSVSSQMVENTSPTPKLASNPILRAARAARPLPGTLQWALLETAETMPQLNPPYQCPGTASDYEDWISNIVSAVHQNETDQAGVLESARLSFVGSLVRALNAIGNEKYAAAMASTQEIFTSDDEKLSDSAAVAFKLSALSSWTSSEVCLSWPDKPAFQDLVGSIIAMANWVTTMSRDHRTMIGRAHALKVKDVLVAIATAREIESCLTELQDNNIIAANRVTIQEVVLAATAGRLLGFSEPQISLAVRNAWSRRTSPPEEVDQIVRELAQCPHKIASLCQRALATTSRITIPRRQDDAVAVLPSTRTLGHWIKSGSGEISQVATVAGDRITAALRLERLSLRDVASLHFSQKGKSICLPTDSMQSIAGSTDIGNLLKNISPLLKRLETTLAPSEDSALVVKSSDQDRLCTVGITLHSGQVMKIVVVNRTKTTAQMLQQVIADYETHIAALPLHETQAKALRELIAGPGFSDELEVDRIVDLHGLVRANAPDSKRLENEQLKASM